MASDEKSQLNSLRKETEALTKRLDAIINIMLQLATPGGRQVPMFKRVQLLHDSGLRPSEIAKILGITPTHAAVEVHRLKVSKTKKSR
jgi:hypothetical protein